MEPNPYEASHELSDKPNHTSVVALRVVAIIAWMLSPLPASAFLIPLVLFEDFETYRGLHTRLFILGSIFFLLPSVGLVLCGAGLWWRTRWLGAIGLAAIAPLVTALIFAAGR